MLIRRMILGVMILSLTGISSEAKQFKRIRYCPTDWVSKSSKDHCKLRCPPGVSVVNGQCFN